MRRLLLIIISLLCLCVPTLAQKVRVFGVAGQTRTLHINSTNTPLLRTFPSCTITVYNTGTLTLTPIWTSSSGLTPQANPFTANSDATYGFFATAGTVVDVRFSGTGVSVAFTISSVTAPNGGGGGGGGGLVDPGSNGIIKRTSFNITGIAAAGTDYLLPTGSGAALTGLTKSQVGLDNVDNTSDATKNSATATLLNKTISGLNNTLTNLPATQLIGIVPIANLATGTPTGAKFIRDDNTLQLIPGGGDALTANPLSQFATTTSAQFAGVVSDETGSGGFVVFSVGPTFTGVPLAPTAAAGTNTTQIATTAHVFAERTNTKTLTNTTLTAPVINSPTGLSKTDVGLSNVDNTSDAAKPVSTATTTQLNLKAPLASPTLTGVPVAPTAAGGTNTTQLATTAFVTVADNLKANLASPTFSGTVGLPAGTVLTTPALTFRTQADNVAIVANSPYRNTTDHKLYIGSYDGVANHELLEAGVSLVNLASNVTSTLPSANGGTGSTLGADTVLSTTSGVDLNTATATLLYTCPASSTCAITKVLITAASTSLTTASISFGWTSAAFNDVIADATHTELTTSTLYTILNAKAGAKLGAATNTFKVLANVLQGGAATVTIKVFGYVY